MKKIQTFKEACRENTGSHMLDSGGAYGRWHEAPPIKENECPAFLERHGGATLRTWAWLEAHLKIDPRLQARWEKWDARHPDLSRFESGTRFCEERLELVQRGRDNTYNGESDLDQCFVWEVYTPEEDDDRDWIYADDDAVTVIYVHTGCDVQGGYGRPLFCRATGDYQVPVDLCCGYRIVAARDASGEPVAESRANRLDENWAIGYSSYPWGCVEEDVERFFWFTRTPETVCALLKSGERVKICVDAPLY